MSITAEKIISIKYKGKQQTYDIEVDSSNHIFYGNGIATSNSHAVSYATISYWAAYCKTHYPLDFYCEKLNQSHHKPKPKIAIKQLITDASKNDIITRTPVLEDVLQDNIFSFYHKDDNIIFGINHIKGIGESKIIKITPKIANIRTWMDTLESGIDKTTMINLLSIGFFDFNLSRKEKIFQYQLFSKLSKREQDLIKESGTDNIEAGMNNILDCVNINRKEIIRGLIKTLQNPPYSLDDDPLWVHEVENELMGMSISYHKTETEASQANTTCREINNGKTGKSTIFVEISAPREYTINRGQSKGKKMGAFSGNDTTGECNCLIFAEDWEKYKHLLYEGAVVNLLGQLSKKHDFTVSVVK